MDGLQSTRQPQIDVEAELRMIRERMPQTYRSIQARAEAMGRGVYGAVRKAVAGAPDTFYAIEAGRVVGTPFQQADISGDVASQMVQFKCKSVVMWGKGPNDGKA